MESTFAVAERLTTRQRQLVDELVDLVLAEGFAQLTLDEVAARLGCSKRTLYALAHSKEQLAIRAVRFFFKRSTERWSRRSPAPDRPPARSPATWRRSPRRSVRPVRSSAATSPSSAATREIYEQNTAAAAVRVRELIDEGIEAGAFRQVPASFVGEVVTATMRRITSGEIGRATGLDDARAYAELARLVVAAVRR